MKSQNAVAVSTSGETSLTHGLDLISQHFMNVLYFDLGRYLIAAGVMSLILVLFRRWARNRKIQDRGANRKDYAREIGSSFRTVFVFGITTLATLAGQQSGIIKLELENAALATILWQFALIVIVHDTYFYWMHRAMHTKHLFRATHLHHHKSRTPTPWAAYSFSPLEAVFEAAFMPLFLLLTSVAGIEYAGFAIFLFLWHMIIRNVMAHAGHELFPAGWVDSPWTRWISTTTHHDLHHSSGHNFGFYFTWWDRWMGTEHPRYAAEFRKNAKPINVLASVKSWLPQSLAEKVSILTMALFVAIMTPNSPIAIILAPVR